MIARAAVLGRIRAALGRRDGAPAPPPPEVLLDVPIIGVDERVRMFCTAVEKLTARTFVTRSLSDAGEYVNSITAGYRALASNAHVLSMCGINAVSAVYDKSQLRALCTEADFGITSADFALADTGTLVMLSSPQEARMISLLPPVHIAVLPRDRILTGLDELLTVLPNPAVQTSSMVLITGPSRTADIEQILVRGVHGPGELHVVIV